MQKIEVYGGVVVRDTKYTMFDLIFSDDELIKLIDQQSAYTTHGGSWIYAGDQNWEESVIVVNDRVFSGPRGLPNALTYIKSLMKNTKAT